MTDSAGIVQSRHDYYAFGEEITAGINGRSATQKYVGDNIRQKYTGYERDDESGLDYAQARYYSSQHGRFTSVDPLTASATIRNPQTFNRYSYALNSPYKFTDPLGLAATNPQCGNGGRCDTQADDLDNEQSVLKRTQTTIIYVDVVEKTKKGAIVQHARIRIVQTQEQLCVDQRCEKPVNYGKPTVTATAENVGDTQKPYSEDDTKLMAKIAKTIVEVSNENGADPAVILGIARTETHMGMLKSKETAAEKQTDINPTQLDKSSGLEPTTDLRENIKRTITHYNRGLADTLNQSLQNYRGPGSAERAAYANTAEAHIRTIRADTFVINSAPKREFIFIPR
jgi:RHS repeat-associated protein